MDSATVAKQCDKQAFTGARAALLPVNSQGMVSALARCLLTIGALACGKGDGAKAPTAPTPALTIVTVSISTTTLQVGQTVNASAAGRDQSGAPMALGEVVWSTTAGSIATVNATGTVTGVAPGLVSITATSGGRTGQARLTVVQIPVAMVSVTPGSVTLVGGTTQQFSAVTLGAAGESLADRGVTWATSDSVTARITLNGLVTAVAPGTAVVTATSEGKSGVATVTVSSGTSPLISSIAPSVLTEGTVATINGTGFTPAATVSIAGLAASVLSSSPTELQVSVPARDCQPQRSESIVVSVASESDTAHSVVKGADPLVLNANSFTWSGSDQCIRLAAAPAGARYVVGMLSTSEVPSALTVSQLFSSVGEGSVVSAASSISTDATRIGVMSARKRLGFPAQPMITSRQELRSAGRRDGRAEARLRESEQELHGSLDSRAAREWLRQRGSVRTAGGFVQQALTLGDTAMLNVPINAAPSCDSAPTVRAVVRYVGSENIWLEDVANPVTAFSVAEYQGMEAFYATHIKPVLFSYFGGLTDIDSNQHNLILITREVNKTPLVGFVWGGDLFPVSLCGTSNSAEIFYGFAPDPDGAVGPVVTHSEVRTQYRSLMAHELTHVVQNGQRLYGTAGTKAIWEMEGGATLAEQLVGFKVYGFASGQNLGLTPMLNDAEWFRSWFNDLAIYFGWLSNTTRSIGAPEQCTWLGNLRGGNSGPCDPFRMVYGVPATLLRFVLDRYGFGYPGGEAALMRNLVASPHTGYASLTSAAGVSIGELLTWFGVMLWSDDKTSDSFASWNLFDIFSGFVPTARLAPYVSTNPQPTLHTSVRAGSTAFLEWSPTGATAPTSFRIRSPAGGPIPPSMVLWVYRYQ